MMTSDRFETSPGVLKIIHTAGTDSGLYSCHASNSVGMADSNVTNFFVQGIPIYWSKRDPVTYQSSQFKQVIQSSLSRNTFYHL